MYLAETAGGVFSERPRRSDRTTLSRIIPNHLGISLIAESRIDDRVLDVAGCATRCRETGIDRHQTRGRRAEGRFCRSEGDAGSGAATACSLRTCEARAMKRDMSQHVASLWLCCHLALMFVCATPR